MRINWGDGHNRVKGLIALDPTPSMFICCSGNQTIKWEEDILKIAITGASGPLGQALTAELLEAGHDVRATDIDEVDVLAEEQVRELCAGMERVVHLACARRRQETPTNAEDGRILDTALKGSWNVMHAAREAGVAQVVQVSDVCIYDGYDEDHILSEDMVPLPDTSAEQQALHLAEGVGHEFAREAPGSILTLRLGRLVDAESLSAQARFDRDWLDMGDATMALLRALELDSYDHPSHWGLYNLVADTPYRRFALRILEGHFAFSPQVDFRAWWPDRKEVDRKEVGG
jgi:hypothetical protein